MKKTVRLTERDLTRIVKRIINENEDEYNPLAWGHNNQEEEDAANEILDKMISIGPEFNSVIKMLYESGIMSYPETKKIKTAFQEIHEKITTAAMKADRPANQHNTDMFSGDWDRSQHDDITNSNRDFILNRRSENKTGN